MIVNPSPKPLLKRPFESESEHLPLNKIQKQPNSILLPNNVDLLEQNKINSWHFWKKDKIAGWYSVSSVPKSQDTKINQKVESHPSRMPFFILVMNRTRQN